MWSSSARESLASIPAAGIWATGSSLDQAPRRVRDKKRYSEVLFPAQRGWPIAGGAGRDVGGGFESGGTHASPAGNVHRDDERFLQEGDERVWRLMPLLK